MPDKIPAYNFAKDQFKCPRCQLVFEGAGVITGKPGGLRKGHIMICSGCGSVLQLGDSEFHQMSPQQIAKLSEASRNQIQLACQMVLSRIAAETKRTQ